MATAYMLPPVDGVIERHRLAYVHLHAGGRARNAQGHQHLRVGTGGGTMDGIRAILVDGAAAGVRRQRRRNQRVPAAGREKHHRRSVVCPCTQALQETCEKGR